MPNLPKEHLKKEDLTNMTKWSSTIHICCKTVPAAPTSQKYLIMKIYFHIHKERKVGNKYGQRIKL